MDSLEQDFLEHLNAVNKINKIPIYSIESKEFISYGRILKGYDFFTSNKFYANKNFYSRKLKYLCCVSKRNGRNANL